MIFLFYKFLFFLSDFLEIQRKSFYLFLNEFLSHEFTKIQPLWFRQNPIYQTGHSFGTSPKRQRPMVQRSAPLTGFVLQRQSEDGGISGLSPEDQTHGASPRSKDFWSTQKFRQQRRSQRTEVRSSTGTYLEVRWPPRGGALKSRKSQRTSLAVTETPQFSEEVRPFSFGQPLESQIKRRNPLDRDNSAAPISQNDPRVDFSYQTLTNLNETEKYQEKDRQRQNRVRRVERGENALQKIPPRIANERITTIHFLSKNYKFIKPPLNIEKSILFSKTYCCHFYMPVQLLDHSTNFTEMKWLFLGTLPLLTRRGHFIINGTPRIILNQIIRSSGIYFHKETAEEKKNSRLFYAEIISKSGPWVRLEVDPKKKIWVSFQQSGITRIPLFHFFQNFYQKYIDHHIFLNEKNKKWNFEAILLNEFFGGGGQSFKEPQNKIQDHHPKRTQPNETRMFLENQKSLVRPGYAFAHNKLSRTPSALARRAIDQERYRPFSIICLFYFKFQKLWPKFKQLKIYSDDRSQNLYQLFSYKKYQIFNWSLFIYLKLKFSQKFTEIDRHVGLERASAVGDWGRRRTQGPGPARGHPLKQDNQWREKMWFKHGVSDELGARAGAAPRGVGFASGGEAGPLPTAAKAVFPRTRLKLGLDILFASSSKNRGSYGGFHLDRFGRIRLNKRLGLSLKTHTLTPIDFLAISDILYRFVKGGGGVDVNNPNSMGNTGSRAERIDDIDDLKNRRLKTIGELLQNQLARGLQRLQKTFENTVQKDWIKFLNYQTYHSSLSFLNSFNLSRKKLGLANRSLLERRFSYSPSLKYTDNKTIDTMKYTDPEINRPKAFFKHQYLTIPVDQILKYYFDKRRNPSLSFEIASSAGFPPKGLLPAKSIPPPLASGLGDVSFTNQVEGIGKYPYGQTGLAAGQRFNFLKKGHGTQKTNKLDLLSYPNIFKKRIFEKRDFYLQQIRKFTIFTNREVPPSLFGYRFPFLTSQISQNPFYYRLKKWHFKRNFVWKELLLSQKTALTEPASAALAPEGQRERGLREGVLPSAKGARFGPSPASQRESQGEYRHAIDREKYGPFFQPSGPEETPKEKAARSFHQQIQNPSAPLWPSGAKADAASQVFFSTSILSILNSLPINSTFKEFFHSHQLSQFLDQSNPLAEITHKRRFSCLGSGGITRETAGMEIRGIHLSHYGRICPIETPEGKNAGLVNSLTTSVNVDNQGFLETPYIEVYKQHYQNQKKLMFFSVEDQEIKRVFLNPRLPKLRNLSVGIIKPQTQNFYKLKMHFLNLVALNPQQFISIATTCIPFIEHDDANRALMGSNMQRQALPLIHLEQPMVTTVNAFRVLSDLKDIPTTSESGMILYVSQQKVSYYPLNKKDLVRRSRRTGFFGQSLFCDYAMRRKKNAPQGSPFDQQLGPTGRRPLPAKKLAFVALGVRLSRYISFQKRGSKFGVNAPASPKEPLKSTVFNRSVSKQFFIQQFENLKIDRKRQDNYKIFRIFFPFLAFWNLEKKKLTKQNINFFKNYNKF